MPEVSFGIDFSICTSDMKSFHLIYHSHFITLLLGFIAEFMLDKQFSVYPLDILSDKVKQLKSADPLALVT